VDDELRTLRERLSQLEEMVARLEVDPLISGVARAFKTTTGGSYPTGSGTNKTFLLIPQDVTAATTEGASGTVTAASGTVKGVNVGPGLPANGTEVLGYYTGTAWVFQY